MLGPVPAARFADAYGVTDEGNWEDVTILSRIWPAVDEPPFRDDTALEAELADGAGPPPGAPRDADAAGP